MSNLLVAFLAYLIDRIFGEFRFIRHPVILIGDSISWFEKHFYKESILRGALLTLGITTLFAALAFMLLWGLSFLPSYVHIILSALIASMFLAHKMLYDAVLELTSAQDHKEKLSLLVSRDTAELSESEVCKAGIETYAENLSDGVIAPFFYLLLFGLPGIIIYKSINTLDSMVGYRTLRYEKYGKVSALLDDIANFIPARLTAMLIVLVVKPHKLFSFYRDGRKHPSPNAGLPITAMALALGVRLGGPTRYFGLLKEKAYFGSGREALHKTDIKKALEVGRKVDILVFFVLFFAIFYAF